MEEHFTFGRNNGLRVSALALGTGNFGTRWGYGADAGTSRAMVDRFADAGGTVIDTAASYQVGESEENVGRILAGRRNQFTIATKFAIGGTSDGSGVMQTGNGRRAMFRSVEDSLRRLDTDYIDLLYVHFPDFVTPIEEIVRAFDDLASAGKILYAGAWLDNDFSRAVRIQPRGTQRRPSMPLSTPRVNSGCRRPGWRWHGCSNAPDGRPRAWFRSSARARWNSWTTTWRRFSST
jgi:aryl-alcohol dehydrogenase-like predicted oxidoreductase